jgi:hypothetical protein
MNSFILMDNIIFNPSINPHNITNISTVYNPYEAQRIQILLALMTEEKNKASEIEKNNIGDKNKRWIILRNNILFYIKLTKEINNKLGINNDNIIESYNNIENNNIFLSEDNKLDELINKFYELLKNTHNIYEEFSKKRI